MGKEREELTSPTPAPGSWEGLGSDCHYHIKDNNGRYWIGKNGSIYADKSSGVPITKVKPWIWGESNKLTYTVAWKGKIAYEETKNKCLDKKVNGNETPVGLREIRNICAKKAKKAQLKAENRVRKWHKFKIRF